MAASRADRIYSNLKNEFLRFNDLTPATNPMPFWTLFSVYALVQVSLLLIANLLPASMPWAVNFFEAAYLAVNAFLIIPASALFLRRYSDIGLVQNAISRLSDFQKRNLMGARLLRAAVTVFLVGAILLFAWVNSGLTALALLVLAAFPSASQKLEQPKTAVMQPAPTLSVLRPPSLSSSPPTAPKAIHPNVTAAFRSDLHEPSKQLVSRIGFWLSLVLALVTFLLALFPSALSDLEAPRFQITAQESVSPAPEASATSEPISESQTVSAVVQTSSDSALAVDADVYADTDTGDDYNDSVVVVALSPDEPTDIDLLDPRFRYCTHAIAAGYGPYYAGVDPEYSWYFDRDGDGIVCER